MQEKRVTVYCGQESGGKLNFRDLFMVYFTKRNLRSSNAVTRDLCSILVEIDYVYHLNSVFNGAN